MYISLMLSWNDYDRDINLVPGNYLLKIPHNIYSITKSGKYRVYTSFQIFLSTRNSPSFSLYVKLICDSDISSTREGSRCVLFISSKIVQPGGNEKHIFFGSGQTDLSVIPRSSCALRLCQILPPDWRRARQEGAGWKI